MSQPHFFELCCVSAAPVMNSVSSVMATFTFLWAINHVQKRIRNSSRANLQMLCLRYDNAAPDNVVKKKGNGAATGSTPPPPMAVVTHNTTFRWRARPSRRLNGLENCAATALSVAAASARVFENSDIGVERAELTNDEADLAEMIVVAARHHGSHRVVDHCHDVHVKVLSSEFCC